jgi:hypothetical protein
MISNFFDVPVVAYSSCGQTEVDSETRNKLNCYCPTYPLSNDDNVRSPVSIPGTDIIFVLVDQQKVRSNNAAFCVLIILKRGVRSVRP